jgi:hypothetical protein
MDDVAVLTDHNRRFIDACRHGSWTMLEPLLSGSFTYLDGATGEMWDLNRYAKGLTGNPLPALIVGQLVIHVDGDTAIVSARSRPRTTTATWSVTGAAATIGCACTPACDRWPAAGEPEGASVTR